ATVDGVGRVVEGNIPACIDRFADGLQLAKHLTELPSHRAFFSSNKHREPSSLSKSYNISPAYGRRNPLPISNPGRSSAADLGLHNDTISFPQTHLHRSNGHKPKMGTSRPKQDSF